MASARCGVVAHWCPRSVQLRVVLPAPGGGRLSPPRWCGRGRGRFAAAPRRFTHVPDRRTAAEPPRPRGRRRGGRRRRSRRRPTARGCRRRRRARRARRQRVVRHGRRAHEALSRATEPARRDRMAAPARWSAAGSPDARRRRSATGPLESERRGLRLPQPGRHRVRVRLVVQRHPQAPHCRASAARPRVTDHGRDGRLGRARSVAVTRADLGLCHHHRSDRLRRHRTARIDLQSPCVPIESKRILLVGNTAN